MSEAAVTNVVLYDTTLRDGAQTAGISFTLGDKLKIARRLAEVGVPYIEGGWPGSNPKDAAFFAAAKDDPDLAPRVTAFGSTRRAGTAASDDANLQALVAAGTQTVAVVGKSWDFHVTAALETTLEENLAMVGDSVTWLREQGPQVMFLAEHFFDGYRRNPTYALAVLDAAAAAGAAWLVLCDTNGGSLPEQVAEACRTVVDRFPGTGIGIHSHNDCELAVANAIAAVSAGATMVQGTVNGYGERCGNANWLSVAAVLESKYGRRCLPDGSLQRLTELSRFVSEVANVVPHDGQPFTGRNAFAHKGGIHVSALLRDPATYEHMPPETVGNERRIVVSELSGRANLLAQGPDGALVSDSREAAAALAYIKEREQAGYQYEDAQASLELALRRQQPAYVPPFRPLGFRISADGPAEGLVEATVRVQVGDHVWHTAGAADGPVWALDIALRKALEEAFPTLADVRLQDYKVRVLDGQDGTAATIRVLITSGDGQRTWGTVGVSPNIIDASWEALVESLEYALVEASSKKGGSQLAAPAV